MKRLIGAAVLLGALAAVSPGLAFTGTIAVGIVWAIRRRSDPREVPYLVGLFVGGLLVRAAIFAVINLVLVLTNKVFVSLEDQLIVPALFGDSGYIIVQAWHLVQFIHGQIYLPQLLSSIFQPYGWGAHLVLLSTFFNLFGFSPFAVTTLNCLFGGLTGLTVYALTREMAGIRAARVAGFLVTFFPSLLLWSVTNLKDPLFILVATGMPWVWWRWNRSRQPRFLLAGLLAPLALWTLRPNFFPGVCATFGTTIWLLVLTPYQRRKTLAFGAVVVLWFLIKGDLLVWYHKTLVLAVSYHQGVVSTGGFYYTLYVPQVYDGSLEPGSIPAYWVYIAYGIGWFHILLEPFPWKIHSALSLAALPQMLMWYPLLGAAFFGGRRFLKMNPLLGKTLLLHLFFLGSVITLGGGNVGTDFRMRDAMTPLILVFSAMGLSTLHEMAVSKAEKGPA